MNPLYAKSPEKHNLQDISIKETKVCPENRYSNKEAHIKHIKEREDIVTLSFCQSFLYYLLPCCVKLTKGIKIMEKAVEIIDERMDVLNILKTLHDVKRTNQVVFDQDQLKLFNLPYRTRIDINQKQIMRKQTTYGTIKLEEKNIHFEEIEKSYDKVKSRAQDSKIDENILKVLSQDYKLLFE